MKSVIKKTCPEPVEGKRKQKRKSAFSLIEMLVVLAIIAILVVLAIPGINAMQKSFNSTGAEGMISAALSTARTLAISRQQYAGVRFQKEYNKKDPQINADQYMIFIVYEESQKMGGLTNGFHAIEGYKPVKLPENSDVIDMIRRTSNNDTSQAAMCENADERELEENDLDDSSANLDPNNNNMNITDTSAFSIIFSPAGKLVIHDIRVRNEDGQFRPPDLTKTDGSDDKVFNSLTNIIINNTGQFVQDDYAHFGLGGEKSRREFYIYDKEKFEKMTTSSQRMAYLNGLKHIYINPYTGEIIKN